MDPNQPASPTPDQAGPSNPEQIPQTTAPVPTDPTEATVADTIQSITLHEASSPIRPSGLYDFLPRARLSTTHQRVFAAIIREALRNNPSADQFIAQVRSDLDPLLLCAPSITSNFNCNRALENKLRAFGFHVPGNHIYKSPTLRVAHAIFTGFDDDSFNTVFRHVMLKELHPWHETNDPDPTDANIQPAPALLTQPNVSSDPDTIPYQLLTPQNAPATTVPAVTSSPEAAQSPRGSTLSAVVNSMNDVLNRFQERQTSDAAEFRRILNTMATEGREALQASQNPPIAQPPPLTQPPAISEPPPPAANAVQLAIAQPPPPATHHFQTETQPPPHPQPMQPTHAVDAVNNHSAVRDTSHYNDPSSSRAITIQKASTQASTQFKDKRFKGTIKDSWPHTVRDYEQYVIDVFSLTSSEALLLLPFILEDEARDYYDQEVRPVVRDYGQAKSMMALRFDNAATQRRILSYLQKLRLSDFLDGTTSINDAFGKLTADIQANFSRIPKGFQGEHFKRELLISAVEGQDWCAIEIQRPTSTYPTYQDLVMALADCSQRFCTNQKNAGNERAAFGNVDKPSSVNYTNPRYGRPFNNRFRSKSSYQRSNHRHQQHRHKPNDRCHYCKQKGHFKRDCPHYRHGRNLHRNLFTELNDSNPEGADNGENQDRVASILQAALTDCTGGITEEVLHNAVQMLDDSPRSSDNEDESHTNDQDNPTADDAPKVTHFLKSSSVLHTTTKPDETDISQQPF